jgi:hypothetical protein
MAGKQGPETRLIKKMRDAGRDKYGDRLVTVKYHGSQFGEAGVSDLLCVLDGVFVAVEAKAPESYGGSVERALEQGPTVKQRAFIARVLKSGGCGGFAATVEHFMEMLAHAETMASVGIDARGDECGGHNV